VWEAHIKGELMFCFPSPVWMGRIILLSRTQTEMSIDSQDNRCEMQLVYMKQFC
jgi:hypothetical protein